MNAAIKRLTRVNRRWLFGLLIIIIIIIDHFVWQHNGDCVPYTSCTGSTFRADTCGRLSISLILTFQLRAKETRRERGYCTISSYSSIM